ncbi:MAG: 30S ribosomal protein S16 [Anaerolineae bacterium]|nr:30S ribosomal protein S16 [Anaerolineae bacterium]
MVRIRLRRQGLKRQPIYRVVITDREAPRNGSFIEIVGQYNPRTEPMQFDIDENRVLYWLSVGAQPSESVAKLLNKFGTAARFERLKKGEATIEALAEEANQAKLAAGPQSLKTRREAPASGTGTFKPKEK